MRANLKFINPQEETCEGKGRITMNRREHGIGRWKSEGGLGEEREPTAEAQ